MLDAFVKHSPEWASSRFLNHSPFPRLQTPIRHYAVGHSDVLTLQQVLSSRFASRIVIRKH